jgi:hypothetical protein
MSTLPEDIHLSPHLVASLRTLQLLLPTTSMGVQLRDRRRLGAIDAPHERSQSLSRSSHVATLGLSKIAQPLVRHASLTVLVGRLADYFSRTHHPRLGLGGGRA